MPCRQHHYRPLDGRLVCRDCPATRSYPDLVPQQPRALVPSAKPPWGVPFGRPWAVAPTVGQTHCCYCSAKFTEMRPPTFDHIVPRGRGGTLDDGWVLACQTCNAARGSAPYEEYLAACVEERQAAEGERRSYKRPKTITYEDGTYIITTESKSERREAAEARKNERRTG